MSITLDEVKGALSTMISRHGFTCGRWESENGSNFARIVGAGDSVVGSVSIPPHILSASRAHIEGILRGVVKDALFGVAREPAAKAKQSIGVGTA
ncbi:MAG: hypothetical protein E6Q97_00765 [Desulfurellales bacterium]|nr:MAG: hypothetical protein E6Q97_00765 [Desulfurellales bacterium]